MVGNQTLVETGKKICLKINEEGSLLNRFLHQSGCDEGGKSEVKSVVLAREYLLPVYFVF